MNGISLLGISAALPLGVIAAAVILILILRRDRRLRTQREILRRAYELGEEVFGSSSVDQILSKVRAVVPKIFGVSNAEMYLYNRNSKTLDAVAHAATDSVSISLAAPPVGPQAGAVACFHYRTLLAIPDTSRSPFPVVGRPGTNGPRSLLFVPMVAQGDVVGILEMDRHDEVRDFDRDEQALAQHLGNQIGVAVKLLDQRSVREQLFRTEKLAAVGQLISGIVNDLQRPLAAIGNLAETAQSELGELAAAAGVAAISAEAKRASEIVTRLVGFAGAGESRPQPVELNDLLRNLIEFREREWKVRGIRVRNQLSEEAMTVLGSHGQLEQVFLNLLVHAEQSLSDSAEKLITIRTSMIARRLLIEISYSGPKTDADPFSHPPDDGSADSGLSVCRSLITGHGGELRFVQPAAGDLAFQVELPSSPREKAASPPERASDGNQMLTALMIEPAEAVQIQLRGLLAARSYRVVPVNSTDEGLDLAQRLRFDVVFCSVHAPGLNWVETAEQIKPLVAAFVLLADSYNAELAADFEGEGTFVLTKPMDERQVDRVLEAMRTDARSRSGLTR